MFSTYQEIDPNLAAGYTFNMDPLQELEELELINAVFGLFPDMTVFGTPFGFLEPGMSLKIY